MIKTFTAFTQEVDDVAVALAEVQEQLAIEGALLTNTVGIVSCYADFVESGVLRAVCEALPFDVVGATTLGSAVKDSEDEILFSIMVMTSDDVSFSTGLTAPISGEDDDLLRDAYAPAAEKLGAKPALMLSFAPLLVSVGGDYFVKAMDGITGGAPNFGTIAVDHNEDYHESAVLYNGGAYPDCYAFLLLAGNVHPQFYVATISPEKVFQEKGVVTASQSNQLQTVNNMPVADYLVGLGLEKNEDGSITGINAFPFIMDLNDGMMPVVRVMFALTPEGYAVCGGETPVGATLSVGSVDANEVVSMTKNRVQEAVAAGKHDCVLIYSCVGRYFYLGYDPTSEMKAVQAAMLDSGIPYLFAYSGCEICPVYGSDGGDATMNRSHNVTCIICAL